MDNKISENYNKINNLGIKKEMKVQDASKDKIDSFVAECINSLQNCQSLNDMGQFLDDNSKQNIKLKKLSNIEYKYNDYYINLGKKFILGPHIYGLINNKSLGLSCMPEFIFHHECNDDKDCVLITRIPDTEDDIPMPYVGNSSLVTLDAKRKFSDEVASMVEKGFTNTGIDDLGNWYIVPKTGRIIISDWSEFAGFPNDKAKSAYKKRINDMCGLIY